MRFADHLNGDRISDGGFSPPSDILFELIVQMEKKIKTNEQTNKQQQQKHKEFKRK